MVAVIESSNTPSTHPTPSTWLTGRTRSTKQSWPSRQRDMMVRTVIGEAVQYQCSTRLVVPVVAGISDLPGELLLIPPSTPMGDLAGRQQR